MYNDKETLLRTEKSKSFLDFSISCEQLKLMFVIILQNVAPGMSIGFSAIALPELMLNLNESSWFASLPTMGSVFGNFLVGYTIDKYGRKKAFFLSTVTAFIGCILLASSRKVLYLFTGQFCMGLAQGATTLSPTVYVAESVAPNNLKFRSSLASWNVMATNFGIFLVYLLGCLFRYNYVALIGATISVLSTILVLIFIPESPAWLDQKGRYKEAEIARGRLGFKNTIVESSSSSSYQSIDEDENLMSYLSKIKRKDVYKPLLITIAYFFFQQFSGAQVFSAYMVDILAVKSISMDPYMLTLVSGVIIVFCQITYTLVLPYMGVRRMGMLSSFGNGVALLLLGISIALNQTPTWYSCILDYIHILAVWCDVFFCGIGIATIPYIIIAEIFPKDAKGIASISVFSVSAFYFSVLMIYPYMLVLSTYGVYLWFSAMSFMSVIFVYKCIPETVGRTLDNLTEEFCN